MKGLDGIQGPIYVGTGCVFRRQALYGFDAPKTKKPPLRTCNCLPKWTYCGCCCSGRKKKKTTKLKFDKKLKHPGKDDGVHAYTIEGVKENDEGNYQVRHIINLVTYLLSSITTSTFLRLSQHRQKT